MGLGQEPKGTKIRPRGPMVTARYKIMIVSTEEVIGSYNKISSFL